MLILESRKTVPGENLHEAQERSTTLIAAFLLLLLICMHKYVCEFSHVKRHAPDLGWVFYSASSEKYNALTMIFSKIKEKQFPRVPLP